MNLSERLQTILTMARVINKVYKFQHKFHSKYVFLDVVEWKLTHEQIESIFHLIRMMETEDEMMMMM